MTLAVCVINMNMMTLLEGAVNDSLCYPPPKANVYIIVRVHLSVRLPVRPEP